MKCMITPEAVSLIPMVQWGAALISRCRKNAAAISASILFLPVVLGQQYTISTIAGGAPPPTPSAARAISIAPPSGLVADTHGNVYFSSNHAIFKLDQSGMVTRIAGTSRPGYSGDGGPAVNAQLNYPNNLALDGSGNLFVVDILNLRIRRISPQGIITTIAGNGQAGLSAPAAEGGPAVDAALNVSRAIAADNSGNVFFWDGGRIRRVSPNGIISTVAGGGSQPPGNGGPATNVEFRYADGLAADNDGNLFISVNVERQVFKLDATGTITTVAGTGASGFSGDGGLAVNAVLGGPGPLTLDGNGNLYVADVGNYRLRKISSIGIISTVAGGGKIYPGDGAAATTINFCGEAGTLSGLGTDASGNLYIAACWIQKITPDGIVHLLGGDGDFSFGGDGGARYGCSVF
jgi:sugar lactone lactonase YvrE